MDSRQKELHEKANELFFRQQYSQAAQRFTEVFDSLDAPQQHVSSQKDYQLSVLNKRATCYMKLVWYSLHFSWNRAYSLNVFQNNFCSKPYIWIF